MGNTTQKSRTLKTTQGWYLNNIMACKKASNGKNETKIQATSYKQEWKELKSMGNIFNKEMHK